MSDQAIPSSLTDLVSELATFGSRHGDSSVGAKLSNKFDAVDGSNPSTTLISQMENTAQDLMEYFNPSISEITGLLSANAKGAQYALYKFQSGIKEYRAAHGPGKTVALGGFVRPRAFGIFAPAIPGFQTSREAISTLVNQNGGTFGTVSTGGIVKKPTTSTLPRPTTAALPSYDLTWGVVGEDGDMKPPTTSPKPKAGRRPVVIGVRDGVDAFQYLLGRNLQIE